MMRQTIGELLSGFRVFQTGSWRIAIFSLLAYAFLTTAPVRRAAADPPPGTTEFVEITVGSPGQPWYWSNELVWSDDDLAWESNDGTVVLWVDTTGSVSNGNGTWTLTARYELLWYNDWEQDELLDYWHDPEANGSASSDNWWDAHIPPQIPIGSYNDWVGSGTDSNDDMVGFYGFLALTDLEWGD
jgi:hypothetical protein